MRVWTSIGAAALLVGSASCLTEVATPAAAPTAAYVAPREAPTPAPPMAGPKRPALTATPIDLASLPAMEVAPLESGAGFTLYTQDVDPKCPEGTRPRRYVGMGIREPLPPRTVLAIGDDRPPFALLDGKYDGATDALTKARLERGEAVWTSVVPVPRSDAIELTRYEGRFDDTRWRVNARAKSTVRPRAIVPGAVYAYRSGEALGIVAPPAVWTSWTEKKTPTSMRERFTLLEIPLRAGEGSSLTVAYERSLAAALHTKVATAEGPGALDLDAFEAVSVEVVWPTDGAPEATVYVGSAHAMVEQLMARPTAASYGVGHCVNLAIDF